MDGWDQRVREGFVRLEMRALVCAGLGALIGLVLGVAVIVGWLRGG